MTLKCGTIVITTAFEIFLADNFVLDVGVANGIGDCCGGVVDAAKLE